MGLFSRAANVLRKRVKLLFTLGFLASITGTSVYAYTLWHVPRIEIADTEIDFGDGKPGERLTKTFTIRNVGNAPLNFSIAKSCGCTDLSPHEGSVQVGEAVEVAVSLELPGHAGSDKQASLTIRSNDPSRELTSCLLTAHCPAPFVISPTSIDFGTISQGSDSVAERQIAISIPSENTVSNSTEILASIDPNAFIAIVKLDANSSPIVSITPKQGLPVGDYYRVLKLQRAGSDLFVPVPIHIRLRPKVEVVPASVFLRRERNSERYRDIQLLVVSHATASPLGPLSLRDGPEGLSIKDGGISGPNRRRVVVSIDGDVQWTEAQVSLHAEGLGTPCTFRLVRSAM